jgi:hypothetical protein
MRETEPKEKTKEKKEGNYRTSKQWSELRCKTVKPACLARETDRGVKSFGADTFCATWQVTDCPHRGQAASDGAPVLARCSKPAPQSLQGGWAGA